MTEDEFHLCLDLMEQDERQRKEREDKRHRAKAWRVILCALACFGIAAVALGVSVWPETVMGANP